MTVATPFFFRRKPEAECRIPCMLPQRTVGGSGVTGLHHDWLQLQGFCTGGVEKGFTSALLSLGCFLFR